MRPLNFHHLYYFWTVAREGHLTRASEKLHISQSALSSQIRQLEAQVDQKLFTREGRRLKLTEAGHLALEYADSIFSLGNELQAIMTGDKQSRVQRLRIGSVTTLSRNFQENFLKPVLGNPDIRLVLESASLEELMENLMVHKLDLILSNRPVASDARQPVRCQRVDQQRICIVGPDTPELKALSLPRDLPSVKVILPGPNSDIRSQFDMYCEEQGVRIDPYAEVDDMAMLRLLARDAGALSVLPEVVVQDEIRSGVLTLYHKLDTVIENFYAITIERHFEKPALKTLLSGELHDRVSP